MAMFGILIALLGQEDPRPPFLVSFHAAGVLVVAEEPTGGMVPP